MNQIFALLQSLLTYMYGVLHSHFVKMYPSGCHRDNTFKLSYYQYKIILMHHSSKSKEIIVTPIAKCATLHSEYVPLTLIFYPQMHDKRQNQEKYGLFSSKYASS